MTPGQAWADQLVFRWDADNRSGNTGFGLVGWSCDPERAEKVFRGVLRKLQVAGDEVAPGLVRIVFSRERVLLVRRVLGHDPGGRPGTVCHALLGSNRALDVETCIGLHRWSWKGSDLPLNEVRGRLDRVPAEVLRQASAQQHGDLSRSLPEVARPLGVATAEVLRHPGSRYTFLDPMGGEFPYRILWGLHRILGELRATHPLGWSFATHDNDDSENFRFVFVRRWPASASHDERRVRTDLEQPCKDRALMLATELVERHLEWLRHGGDGPSRVPAALAAAAEGLGRLEPGDALLAAAERALNDLGPTVMPTGPGPRHRQGESLDGPAICRSEEAPAPEPAPAAPPPDARPESRDGYGLLQALRDALNYEETSHIVQDIRHRFADWPPALQAESGRIALEKNVFCEPRHNAGGQPPAVPLAPDPVQPARSVRPVRPARPARPARPSRPGTASPRPPPRYGTRSGHPHRHAERPPHIPGPERDRPPLVTVTILGVLLVSLLVAIFVSVALW